MRISKKSSTFASAIETIMDWSFLIKDKDALCVTTDSRKVTPECIFVALKGEHFDGNDFVEQAFAQGAAWVLMEDREKYNLLPKELQQRTTLPAENETGVGLLQSLARAWRESLSIPVIGITGTNGKTTTKELTAAVLATKYNLHYTQGNLNNQIGVPLTLLQITRSHNMAIIEMGASHPGDISELVEIAEPTCGLITNVGYAHLQGFGSFEGVQTTKRELYDFLVAHGGAIFRNSDNPYLAKMVEDSRKAMKATALSPCREILYQTGIMPADTHLIGAYNAENISAAICVGQYFGVNHEDALTAIRAYIPSNNRSQLLQTEKNTIVVDAYNANPTSMQAAINAFDNSPQSVYILGAMRELGDYTRLAHQNIVNMLLERRAEKVLLVGDEYTATTAPYPVFKDVNELCAYLDANPISGAKILLKGSRSNQLEKIIPYL